MKVRFFSIIFVLLAACMSQAQVPMSSRNNSLVPSEEYVLSWQVDASLLAAATGLAVWSQLSYRSMPDPLDPDTGPPAEPTFAWDRPFKGTHSSGAALASDLLIWGGGTGALATLWILDWRNDQLNGTQLGTEAVILLEAMAINSSLNLIVRSQAFWARPEVFAEDAPSGARNAPQARGSFYSGHASNAFTLASVAVALQRKRVDPSVPLVPFAIGAYSLATVVSGLRVAAGKHYPSDVVVGALVGAGIGWLVPWLHQRKVENSTTRNTHITGSANAEYERSASIARPLTSEIQWMVAPGQVLVSLPF
jgi:membrane-associated phospholipid phosphatase